MVALNLEAENKTVANLETRKAFTLAVPGTDTLRESDFLGIATSNKMADKFERTGLHAVKSERVDAPVITEYPLTLECEVVEMQSQPYGLRVLGKIVNVNADEKILDDAGKIDAGKIHAFTFDQMQNGRLASGAPGGARFRFQKLTDDLHRQCPQIKNVEAGYKVRTQKRRNFFTEYGCE